MTKPASVFAILVLGVVACGGAGARPPKAAVIPQGAGWSCERDSKSSGVNPCFRNMVDCNVHALKGNPEGAVPCVEAKTASCMTFHQNGKDDFNCFDSSTTCRKFADFMKARATDISACADLD